MSNGVIAMKEIARQGSKDVSVWTDQDAKKAAQAATSIGSAAIDVAKRAKNLEMLEDAVAFQIHAQADFVEWWDGQDKAKNQYAGSRSETGTLDTYGLSKATVSRWRKKLTDDGKPNTAKVESVINDTVARFAKVLLPDDSNVSVLANSGEVEWYTPGDYIELARKVMGSIDTDPASNDVANETVKAAVYHTIDNCGLEKEWHGNVWLNPPYATKVVDSFIAKLIEEYKAGRTRQAVLLVNNATDTKWFADAVSAASVACFKTGRIAFINTDGNAVRGAAQGQIFLYFGAKKKTFINAFKTVGWIAEVKHD